MMTPAVPQSESDVLASLRPEIDAYLTRILSGRGMPEILEEALRYSVLADGKRLRPALALLACEAVGGSRKTALPPAAALELIHTFSLVHDDLPAMDDDVLRRGRPTLHVQAGEALAILAGDAMMSLAFELLAETDITAEGRDAIVRLLSHATSRMIAGQVYDTLGGLPAGLGEREQLALVHRNKTGALLAAACEIGGWCGRGDEATRATLRRYGEAVGLMFQIADDCLDVTQTTEHVGKTTGKDDSAGKLTYPGVFGLEGSQREIDRLLDEACAAIVPFGEPGEPLRRLAADMAVRTR